MRFKQYNRDQLVAIRDEALATVEAINREMEYREKVHSGEYTLTYSEKALVQQGEKIQAVASVRDRLGCSILEAHRVVKNAISEEKCAA